METLRMPAEWEAHDAIWLALPHDREEWGAPFSAARQSVRRLADELVADEGCERVEVLVDQPEAASPHPQRRSHLAPYGDIWLRDTGPLFVHRNGELVALSFVFNGWGGKYLFEHDPEVAVTIAELAGIKSEQRELCLEGGAIDCNGQGSFLSTRQCLLNENRNPGMSEADVEHAMEEALGCQKLIWLDRGLRGDHTDGHVDNLARFVGPTRALCMAPSDNGDPNAEILREVQQSLSDARTAEGEILDVVTVPSPGAVEGPSGPMAASYCNFLIANRCVVVPVFGIPTDSEALAVIGALFPERRIVGLDACALLTGGGTVHCISQQQPSAPAGSSL